MSGAPSPATTPALDTFEIRALTPADASAFRALRLEALERDGRYFAASYEAEAAQPLDAWRARCTETDRACALGLFDRAALVGITAISPWSEDDTDQTALFGSSYIRPAYRGRDLAPMLYAARLHWAAASGVYRRAVVFHRDGNRPSKQLNERFGGRYAETRLMQWADGETAPGHWYQIDLASPAHRPLLSPRPGNGARPLSAA